MSTIEQSVNALEHKLTIVLQKLDHLKSENISLANQLEVTRREKEEQVLKTAHWKNQYDSLKIAKTILGSNSDKRETKLKINALIRDIDHCITQLSK